MCLDNWSAWRLALDSVEQSQSSYVIISLGQERYVEKPITYFPVQVSSGSDSQPSGSTPLEVDPQQPQPRRSNRGNVPRRRFEIKEEAFMIASQDDDEPKTVQEAISSSVSDEWMKAMNDEIESMRTNQVWDLVDLPSGHKAIGNKWVLKIKRKADGSIELN